MTALLAFVVSPIGRIVTGTLAVVAIALGLVAYGVHHERRAVAEAALKAKVEAARELQNNQVEVRGKSDVALCIELSGDRAACEAAF